MIDPICLCGSMFGLGAQGCRLQRHRLFECSFPIAQPPCQHDERPVIAVYGGHARRRAASAGGRGTKDTWEGGHKRAAAEAMGIDWATLVELRRLFPRPMPSTSPRHSLRRVTCSRPPKGSRGVRAVRSATAPLSTNCHVCVIKRSPNREPIFTNPIVLQPRRLFGRVRVDAAQRCHGPHNETRAVADRASGLASNRRRSTCTSSL
jgi:hypothetical protein